MSRAVGSLVLAFVFAVVVATANIAAADNIVVNGGFETGDFTGWNLSGGSCPAFVAPYGSTTACGQSFLNPVVPHSGTYSAEFSQCDYQGCDGPGTVSQDLATVAGESYTLSFWLSAEDHGYGVTPNEMTVSWGGTQIADIVDLSTNGWVEYTFFGLTATGNSTQLSFTGWNNPSITGLDDVFASTVPEPGSMSLLATGLIGLAGAWRRKMQS